MKLVDYNPVNAMHLLETSKPILGLMAMALWYQIHTHMSYTCSAHVLVVKVLLYSPIGEAKV